MSRFLFRKGALLSQRNLVGINMAVSQGSNPEQPFANVVKSSDNGYNGYAGRFVWQTDQDVGGTPGKNWGADVQVDANGYPTSFVGVSGKAYNAFTRNVLYGQNVDYIALVGYLANSVFHITNSINQLVSPILVNAVLNGSNGNNIDNVTLPSQVNATTWNTSLGNATFTGYIAIVTTGTAPNLVHTPTLFVTPGSIGGSTPVINVGATIVGTGISAGTTLVSGGGGTYVVSISQTVGSSASPIAISSSYNAGSNATPLYWTVTQPTPDTVNYFPPGRYAISFNGTGTIAMGKVFVGGNSYGNNDDSSAASYGLTGYGAQTFGINYGVTTFTNTGTGAFYGVFDVTTPLLGLSISWLAPSIGGAAIASGAGNYPTNVIVCLESQLGNCLANPYTFNPNFMAQLTPYSWGRFMEWTGVPEGAMQITFSNSLAGGGPGVGATSATLATINGKFYGTVGWPYETKSWPTLFYTGEIRTITATCGSPVITWSGELNIPCLQNMWTGNMAYVPLATQFSELPQVNDVTWASARGVPYQVCMALCNQMGIQNGSPAGYWHNHHAYANMVTTTAQTSFNGTLNGTTLTMETTAVNGSLRNGSLCLNPNTSPYVFQGYIANGLITITNTISGSPMAMMATALSPGTVLNAVLAGVIKQFSLGAFNGSQWAAGGGITALGSITNLVTFTVVQLPNGLAISGNGILNGSLIYSLNKKQYLFYGTITGNNITLYESTTITATIPLTSPYTITPTNIPNSGTFYAGTGTLGNAANGSTTLGVKLSASPFTTFTNVTSAPAAGQFSVSAGGTYTFNAANAGASVALTLSYSTSAQSPLQPGMYLNGLDSTLTNQLNVNTYVENRSIITGYVTNSVLTIVGDDSRGFSLPIAVGSTVAGTDTSTGNPTSGKKLLATIASGSGSSWSLSETNTPGYVSTLGSASNLVTFQITGTTLYALPSQNAGNAASPVALYNGPTYAVYPSSQNDYSNPGTPPTITLNMYTTPGCAITGTGTLAGTSILSYGSTPGTFTVSQNYASPTAQIPLVSTPLTAAFFMGYISSGTLHVTTLQSGTIQAGSQIICQNATSSDVITSGGGTTWTTTAANVGSLGSPVQMQAAPCLLSDGYAYYAEQEATLIYNNHTTATGGGPTYTEYDNEVWNDQFPWGNYVSRNLGTLQFPVYQTQSIVVSAQEWFGVSTAKLADITQATINALAGNTTTFATQFFCYMGSQYGAGGPVDQLNDAMTTPDWKPDGITQSAAWTHNIRGACFAPYFDSSSNTGFVLNTSDIATLLSQSDPLSEFFALMYSQTGASGQVYNSCPTTTLFKGTPQQVTYSGFLGYSYGETLGMISNLAGNNPAGQQSYPWVHQINGGLGPIYHTYEGGAGFEFYYALGSLTAAQVTALSNLVYAAIDDPRMALVFSDLGNVIGTSYRGYLPGMRSLGIYGVTIHNSISPFSPYGCWGATQSSMQATSPLSSAPGKFVGTLKYSLNKA